MHRSLSPRAIVFDLDGTLVDSAADIAAACNHALAKHGRAPLDEPTVRTMVGDGARWLVARAFGMRVDAPDVDGPLSDFRAYYEAHPCDRTTLLDGAREVLAGLDGIPLCLVTNKPRVTTMLVLECLGIAASFRAVFAGGDGPLKPDPEGVRRVLAQVGVSPREAWTVGDGPQDVRAGRAAGAFTVGVVGRGAMSPEALRAAEPDVVLTSLRELLDLAKRA